MNPDDHPYKIDQAVLTYVHVMSSVFVSIHDSAQDDVQNKSTNFNWLPRQTFIRQKY